MIEAPKPLWYCAGGALLVIALAVGWRIVDEIGNVKIQGGDLSISLDGVQQNISTAQLTVAQVQKEAQAQHDEIVQLEQTISADQARIPKPFCPELEKST